VKEFWARISKHPTWSTVIGGLILLVATDVWTGYGPRSWLKTEPTKVVAPTTTLKTPPPVAQTGLPPGSIIWPDAVELPADEVKTFDLLTEAIRSKNHVKRLAPEEDNVLIKNAPRGVFVYIQDVRSLLERPITDSRRD
jgi:hypothetical protein